MKDKVAEFLRWHIEPRHLFTPVATTNVLHTVEILPEEQGTIIRGCTHVFIFGVRVASFQRTAPWQQTTE